MSNLNDNKFVQLIFTRGACDSLALALNTLTGFPLIVAFIDAGATHVGVSTDKGVLDIYGYTPLNDWINRWGNSSKIVSRSDLDNYSEEFVFDTDEKSAMPFAEQLLKAVSDG